MAALWGELVPDEDKHDTEPIEYLYEKFPEFFTQDAQLSFCHDADEMPNGRFKTVHTQGLVAKVEWVPTDEARAEGYTATLNTGSDHIIMRLSETNNLDHDTSPGLLPSISLKFLRDGDMSFNIVAMPSFTTTDSWNWFEYPLSNNVTPFDEEKNKCERRTIMKKMIEGSERPFETSISDLARYSEDGTILAEEAVKVPYRLQFESAIDFPREKEYETVDDDTSRWIPWYEQLLRIPEGSTIYEVYALTGPEVLDGELIKIADLKLRSSLYASEFGDKKLFFRHQGSYKDRKFWPGAWKDLREGQIFS